MLVFFHLPFMFAPVGHGFVLPGFAGSSGAVAPAILASLGSSSPNLGRFFTAAQGDAGVTWLLCRLAGLIATGHGA
jgi:hypothetical protein